MKAEKKNLWGISVVKAWQHGAERVFTSQMTRGQEMQEKNGKTGCEERAKELNVWIVWDLMSAILAVTLLPLQVKLSSARSASKMNLIGVRCRHMVISEHVAEFILALC